MTRDHVEQEPGHSAADGSSRLQMRHRRSLLVRRFLSLTFLSTIIPGLGLLWTRKRRLGMVLIAISVLGILVLLIFLLAGGALHGAAQALTSTGLKVAFVSVLVAMFLWLTSVVMTARVTHTPGWSKRAEVLHRAFTALMCLIVTMPAALAVRNVAATQDAFGSMFIDGPDGKKKDNVLKKKDRVNFLLIGSDAGQDRFKVRTDSLMVASVDTHTGDTTLVSIPRNLQKVPFPKSNPLHKIYPDGYTCPQAGKCIMDAVWSEAEVEHPDLFPSSEKYKGLETTRDVVSEITGLDIDYSTVINLQGFRDLVNAMGGVDLNVPKGGLAIGGRISGGVIVPGSITGRLPEGRQHLNGQEALWYARSRVETGDSDRMRRQRCMVNALISQSNPVELVDKFTDIMRVAKQNILIDLPQDYLPDLADLANTIKKGQMKSVNLAYPVISDSDPDFAKIRQLVKKGLQRPKATAKPKPSASSTTSTSTTSSSTTAKAISDTKDDGC